MTIAPQPNTTEPSAWSLEAVNSAFESFSYRAAREAPALPINPPSHILREDIVRCLEEAAGAPLSVRTLAAIHRSFPPATAPLISWKEFQACYTRFIEILKQSESSSNSGPGSDTRNYTKGMRSRARLLAARRKGCLGGQDVKNGPSRTAAVPTTSSQEIGWYAVDAAASQAVGTFSTDGKGSKGRKAALSGTDVTKGGEGRSLQSYYGAALGRTF